MSDTPHPYLLLHPALVPAKWLLLADLLADMNEEDAIETVIGARTRAWAAEWLSDDAAAPQSRVLGNEPEKRAELRKEPSKPPALEPHEYSAEDWATWDAISVSYTRPVGWRSPADIDEEIHIQVQYKGGVEDVIF